MYWVLCVMFLGAGGTPVTGVTSMYVDAAACENAARLIEASLQTLTHNVRSTYVCTPSKTAEVEFQLK